VVYTEHPCARVAEAIEVQPDGTAPRNTSHRQHAHRATR
jgi:hypothetical protein